MKIMKQSRQDVVGAIEAAVLRHFSHALGRMHVAEMMVAVRQRP